MSDWPIYYKDLIRLGNPAASVGIVCLWTISDLIIHDLDPESYASAGQLYTKNGINYLVRNLLANKKIRYLIVCGQDRAGSGQELLRLWQNSQADFLHAEIDQDAIRRLIANVQLIDMIGQEDGSAIQKRIAELDQARPAYGEAETFPEPAEKNNSDLECAWPTDTSVFKVTGPTIADTWLQALKTILKFGDTKLTDAMTMKEVHNLVAIVTDEDPDNFYLPDWLGFDQKKIDDYTPQILSGEKNPGLHYTYGHRLQQHFPVNQIQKIIAKLKLDPNAREAIGVLFDPAVDHDAEHRPCIVLIQTLFNRGRLNFTAYVRSHDIFGGWHLNAFGLRRLQKQICDQAGLPLGVLTMISASAHIYDFNWTEAKELVAKHNNTALQLDPRGYFKIDIDKNKKEITVRHFSYQGEHLQTFAETGTEKIAFHLATRINDSLSISLTAHALDLGIELNKAETALRLGLDYVQDGELKFT